jgi:4-amino-4-deoxy-L-arabinose transferase-like glycosyltransferase
MSAPARAQADRAGAAEAAPTTGEVRHFGRWLAAAALVGLAARLIYALAVAPTLTPRGDTLVYHWTANGIADGHGYATVASLITGHPQPTAEHPPLYSLYLALFSKLGIQGLNGHRAVSCLLGAAAVALIGLLGRRVGGPRVGLIAAAVAAVYPQLFMVDGTVIAESLYAPLVVLCLLLAYRLIDRPAVAVALALGGAIGLATLTRSEAIVLLALLAAPAAWRAGAARLRLLAVCVAATAVVIAPWAIRNAVELHRFVPISTNDGRTALATSCPSTYYGSHVGFADNSCITRSPCVRIRAEAPQDSCMRREASRYVRRHLSRVPIVLLARVARLWEVYGYHNDLGYGELWSRQVTVAKVGLVAYAGLLMLAVGGLVLLRRRRVPLLPLLAPFVLVTIVALTAFGFSRYRLAAEPSIVVLAAVALEHLWALAALGAPRRQPVGRVAPDTTDGGWPLARTSPAGAFRADR